MPKTKRERARIFKHIDDALKQRYINLDKDILPVARDVLSLAKAIAKANESDDSFWFRAIGKALSKLLSTYTRQLFGPRCKEYDANCPCCRVWRCVEDFTQLNS